MKSFNTFLKEFPHLTVGGGQYVIDFEFEMKEKWTLDQVKDYLKKLLSGEKVETKNPNHTIQIPKEYASELAKKAANVPYIENWIKNKFDENAWKEIKTILNDYV